MLTVTQTLTQETMYLENWSIWVRVDSNNALRVLHAGNMLNST